MINALPDADSISEENADTVSEQLDMITDMIAELSPEDQARLDLTKYHAVQKALKEMQRLSLLKATVLPAPENAKWDDTEVGLAAWDAVEGSSGYEVKLFSISGPSGHTEQTNLIKTTETSYQFTINSSITKYDFEVRALGSDGSVSDFVRSDAKTFDRPNAESFKVTIYLDTMHPSAKYKLIEVKSGERITPPELAPKDGYKLNGWLIYGRKEYWDFDDPVTSDMTISPDWQLIIEAPKSYYARDYCGSFKWDPVEGTSGYRLQLYKENGEKEGQAVTVDASTTFYNFPIQDTSVKYIFGIRALDQNGEAGPESKGDPITYLPSPQNIRWGSATGTAYWRTVNEASGYILRLYYASSPGGIGSKVIKEITINNKYTSNYKFDIDSTLTGFAFSVSAIPDLNDKTKRISASPETYSNMKLFDRVNVEYVDVHYDANGGFPSKLATDHTRVGYLLNKPTGVSRPGYKLVGWQYNPSKMWDFKKDVVKTSMTLKAIWSKEGLSSDTGLRSVYVDDTRGSISGSTIRVTLPRGSYITDDPSDITINTKNNAKVTNLKTENEGRTWTFTVIAEDGYTSKDYTLRVSVSSSSSSSGSGGGGGGGGSSSGGGGGAGSSGGGPGSVSGGSSASGPAQAGTNGTWKQDATGWWFETPDGGYPADAWYECEWNNAKQWYHFNPSGYLDHGWYTDKDGNTYYLHDTHDDSFGYMYAGWKWINGKCYYFNPVSGQNGLPYGALFKNTTTPDGYTVNEAGEWVVNGTVQIQQQTQPAGDYESFKAEFLNGLASSNYDATINRDGNNNVTIQTWDRNGRLEQKMLDTINWVKSGAYSSSAATDLINSWNRLAGTIQQLAQLRYQRYQHYGLNGTLTYELLTNDSKVVALRYQNGVLTYNYTG
ncbi:MAG: InlB B-repeat-containing protein [Eubacteriales bacterium]|nr:InlB B-repeat-containing protein [Eubacteriales bacterium]